MLNELAQVVSALERLGTATGSRHPRIQPMGKNNELLILRLAEDGRPASFSFVPGETAATLFRVEHGAAGSSFPGFNLPTPLRNLQHADPQRLKAAVDALLTERKNTKSSIASLASAGGEVFKLSISHSFSPKQKEQFKRSVGELVVELGALLQPASPEVENLRRLLNLVTQSNLVLPQFADDLAQKLFGAANDDSNDRGTTLLMQDILFGFLDWKNRAATADKGEYWEQKAEADEDAKQPVYLDVEAQDHRFKPVAHPKTSECLNIEALRLGLALSRKKATKKPDLSEAVLDAFTGQPIPLQDKYPAPKIAELGNLKLFSVNTNEVHALFRYRLKGSASFPASASIVQKMSDALLYLASDERKGKTCIPIPSDQPDKRDLLIAYLEEAPDFPAELAEMFGGEAQDFNEADFRERTQSVLQALEGKLASTPDLNIRLLAPCSVDKAKKQLSLNRRFTAAAVIEAVRIWEDGARNSPPISIWFYDKISKTSIFKTHVVPHPLDVASTLNRVWSAEAKTGYSPSFQRAVSAADAYDVFLTHGPLALVKSKRCLGVLLTRMTPVFKYLGAAKTFRERSAMGDTHTLRWQCAKGVSLLAIFLQKLGHQKIIYMKESTYEIGRLLALADSLHHHYCKHVRDGKSPSQLIGNALFSTALEQPVFALARLAERLVPYQAWARTFQSNDSASGVGLVKYFLSEIGGCTAAIQLEQLPSRMSDADKAKLLLGYLADHSQTESETK